MTSPVSIPRPQSVADPRETTAPSVHCYVFNRWRGAPTSTLVGHCDVHVPRMRVKLLGRSLHQREGRRWANLPSRPVLDDNGCIKRNDSGEKIYAQPFEWDTPEIRRAFSDAVVASVIAYDPTAFDT